MVAATGAAQGLGDFARSRQGVLRVHDAVHCFLHAADPLAVEHATQAHHAIGLELRDVLGGDGVQGFLVHGRFSSTVGDGLG